MYFFGHIGITLFLATMFSLSIIFVLIGVLLPDVIDKSLFFIGIAPCPRFIGHSVFIGPIAGALTFLITRNRNYAIAIVFGTYLHLIEDVGNFMVPWFYPLVNYEFICPPTYEIVFTPYIIATEIIGITLLGISIKFKNKLKVFGSKILKKIFKF